MHLSLPKINGQDYCCLLAPLRSSVSFSCESWINFHSYPHHHPHDDYPPPPLIIYYLLLSSSPTKRWVYNIILYKDLMMTSHDDNRIKDRTKHNMIHTQKRMTTSTSIKHSSSSISHRIQQLERDTRISWQKEWLNWLQRNVFSLSLYISFIPTSITWEEKNEWIRRESPLVIILVWLSDCITSHEMMMSTARNLETEDCIWFIHCIH